MDIRQGHGLAEARLPGLRFAWFCSALMMIGALTTTFTALSIHANNMFTAYLPLTNHPAFYIGMIFLR